MATQHRTGLPLPRDFLKCDQCRTEHKKCLPRSRDWDVSRQKCERCERLGHDCGPPKRKARLPSKDSETNDDVRQVAQISSSSDKASQTAVEMITWLSKPLEPWAGCADVSTTVEAATLVSTQVVMVLYLSLLCKLRQDPRLPQTKVDNLHKSVTAIISKIRIAFKAVIRSSKIQLDSIRGIERQLLGWTMMSLTTKHEYLSAIEHDPQKARSIPDWGMWLHSMNQDATEACILSCTAKMLPKSEMSDQEAFCAAQVKPEHYHALAQRMKRLIERFRGTDDNDGSSNKVTTNVAVVHDTIPAAHIAYLNHDRDTAFRLWLCSDGRQSDTDFLGRTFVHLVVTADDNKTMYRMVERYPDAIRLAGCDWLGLSPLDLATGQTSRVMQDLLGKYGCQLSSAPRQIYSKPSQHDLGHFARVSGYPYFGHYLSTAEQDTSPVDDTMADIDEIHQRQLWYSAENRPEMAENLSSTTSSQMEHFAFNSGTYGQCAPITDPQSFPFDPMNIGYSSDATLGYMQYQNGSHWFTDQDLPHYSNQHFPTM